MRDIFSITTLEFSCQVCGETVTCGPTQADIERIVTKVCGACEQEITKPPPTLRETLGPIVDHDANPDRDRREYNTVCMKRIGHASWCERREGHVGDCEGPPPQYEVRRDVDKKFVPDTPQFGISFNRGGWIEVREPKPKNEG